MTKAKNSLNTTKETSSFAKDNLATKENVDRKANSRKISAYEEERLQRIQQNLEMMKQMGLSTARSALADITANELNRKRRLPPKRSKKQKLPADEYKPRTTIVVSSRASKRLKGEVAPSLDQIIQQAEKEKLEQISLDTVDRGTYSHSLWKGRPNRRMMAMEVVPKNLCTPLTLGSIGTTIESVGNLKIGSDEDLYWSSPSSLYRHRYPIGWKASKIYFDRLYYMEVKEGQEGQGPIFEVYDEMGNMFRGQTPTQPWTEVCVRSKSPGTRVSGPLFFGFSDPISQKLIQQLEENLKKEQLNDDSKQ